jgi:hypothetical protein
MDMYIFIPHETKEFQLLVIPVKSKREYINYCESFIKYKALRDSGVKIKSRPRTEEEKELKRIYDRFNARASRGLEKVARGEAKEITKETEQIA